MTNDPCAGAGQAVAIAWDDAARSTTQQSFEATGLGFAKESFARFDEDVSAYGASLSGEADEACRDTRVRGVQSEAELDRRLACLRDEQHRVDRLLHAAQRADADFVVAAIPGLAKMKDPTACHGSGKIEDALVLHRRALPILEATMGDSSTTVAVSSRDQARALRSAERWQEAQTLLERSVRIYQRSEAAPTEVTEARFDLAQALWHDEPAQPRRYFLRALGPQRLCRSWAPRTRDRDRRLARGAARARRPRGSVTDVVCVGFAPP